ncbi:MAG: AAA family ATPase [Alphaproteobacteria bacterium]|nr:AAA family ATPase [Alphaproteobacteria bacterium]
MAEDISQWLDSIGLGQYARAFADNGIDIEALPYLRDEDFEQLGVLLGHMRRLQAAIRTLPANDSPTRSIQPPSPEPEAHPAEAERRQLTVMFCDLVGSTALSQKLDPEDLRDVMRSYQDAVVDAVSRFGGHVAKYLGDGVLAYFGWPQAYEDQSDRAVRAGLDAVSAVARLTLDNGQPLAARVGIATGQVVVGDLVGKTGRETEAVTGQTPNLAARLQSLAEQNQVVIGADTRRLIGTAFELEDFGKHDLKGFSQPVSVWRVVGEDVGESRFEVMRGTTLAPLIGREHELGLLLERWELAMGGEGQVVELSGEAGIGKSRIVRTLLEAIAEKPHFRLRYQCSPHHTNSAYYPIISRIERAASFASADDADARLDKLEKLLRMSGQDIRAAAPWFAALLSLPGEKRYGKLDLTPQQLREHTSKALMDQVLGLARLRPVLFVLEDVHWIDPTTWEFLEQLAPGIADAAVLILITHRQEEARPLAALSHLTSVTLNRLSRVQGKKIILTAGGAAFPDEVMDQIVARADGVPLYVEELTRSVVDAGGEASAADIPETLQASLTARLDHLGEAKEIVQIGAVIGRDFGHGLLAAVADRTEIELATALDRIVRSELVFRRGVPPDATYTFKHALVQDAAYQLLLKPMRQDLHRQVAEQLESRFLEVTQTQPELLAHHYIEAGLAEKSVPYWFKAGQQAVERSANLEAIVHLTRGRALLVELPASAERDLQELEFCLALGPAFMSTKGLAAAEAEEIYVHARKLSQSIDQAALSFQAAWGLWLVFQQRGQIDLAQTATEEVLLLAERQKENVDYSLQAHHAAWTTQLFIGKFATSQTHIVEGEALYDIEKHRNHAFIYGGHDPGVCAKTTASETLCLLGYAEQAVKKAVEGVALAERLSHPFSLVMAHYFMGQVHQYRLEPAIVRTHAQVTFTMCESHGFESYKAQAAVLLGWATAAGGECETGIAQIREGLAAWQSTGTGMRRPYFLALLADALLLADQTEEGLNIIAEAEALIERTGETRWHAETVRLKGALMDRTGAATEDIEATYQRALEIARGQEARCLQLRAATSLGQLWHGRGKGSETRELLGPLYAWFTEGFETPDVIRARALLDELP